MTENISTVTEKRIEVVKRETFWYNLDVSSKLKYKKKKGKKMMKEERIEEIAAQYPLCQYNFLDTKELVFSEQVRYICETECPRYGKSWSCPPATGTVEECRKRCLEFEKVFVFTTVAEVEDIANMECTLPTRQEHEKVMRAIRDEIAAEAEEVLGLSTDSCDFCRECTYPDAPCRHPEMMNPCIESYGILVTDAAEKAEIDFFCDSNTVTWFSMIFFR